NPDGSFLIQGLGMGRILVQAEGEGLASIPLDLEVPSSGLEDAALRVQRTRTLTVSAELEGVPCDGEARAFGLRGSRVQLDAGKAGISGLLDGAYMIEVECDGT